MSSGNGKTEAIKLTYREAMREAMRDAMRRDERVFLMGEDVGRYGGCFAVSKGLLQEFGPERIRDAPLSESAFVGAGIGAAATFVTAVARRELGLAAIQRAFLGTAETTAMVFMIFLGADMLNAALALSRMPAELAQSVAALQLQPIAIVAGILLFYVLLCSVMDELSMIILTVPILVPVVTELSLWGLTGTEKVIWFGILVLSVVEIGLIAPPVGLNVYVVSSFARDVPMSETYRGVLPFLASDAVRVALLLTFPALSLWAVRLIG